MKIKLIAKSRDGKQIEECFDLKAPISIGRSEENAFQLHGKSVSRKHVELLPVKGGGIQLRKLSDFSKVKVNQEWVDEAFLKFGDQIQIGDYELEFQIEEANEELREATSVIESEEIVSENDDGSEIESASIEDLPDYTEESSGALEVIGDQTEVLLHKEYLFLGIEEAPFDEFRLDPGNKFVIGRGQECDLVVKDLQCSRKHVEFTVREDGTAFIEDLGSGNGTYVNEKRVNRSEIFPGDRIRLGSVILEFQIRDEDFVQEVQALPPQIGVEKELFVQEGSHHSEELSEVGSQVGDLPTGLLPFGSELSPVQEGNALLEQNGGGDLVPGSSEQKKSLLYKFRNLPPRRQAIWGLVACVLTYWILDEEPVRKPASHPKGASQSQQKGKKGEPTFESLSPQEKEMVDASYNKSLKHFQNAEFTECLMELQRIFSLLPDYKNSRNLQALAKRGYAKLEEEKRSMIRKLEEEKRKKELVGLVEKTKKLVSAGNYEEAERWFSRILELDPENEFVAQVRAERERAEEEARLAQVNQQREELAQQKRRETLKIGERLLSQEDYLGAMSYLAELASEGGSSESAEARTLIEQAQNEMDSKTNSLLSEAKSSEDMGERVEAYQKYRKALKINPEQTEAKRASRRLASVMEGEAKRIYTEAVISKSLGQVDRAKELFQQVMEKTPEGSDYHERAKRNLEKLF